MKTVGGFGSAGSSRSLRRTATRGGVANTATVTSLIDVKRARTARLDNPPVDVIRTSIKGMWCAWCNDPRTFKSLSGHWVKAHSIDLQEVRDLLQVPKNYSFISEDTLAKFSARGKRLYDPKKLHVAPGGKRVLSKFGVAANRAKSARYRPPGTPGTKEHMARMNAIRRAHLAANPISYSFTCVVCGTLFTVKPSTPRRVCSTICLLAKRSKDALERIARGEGNIGIVKPKECAWCNSSFHGRQGPYCSKECGKKARSDTARRRIYGAHGTHMRAVHRERQAAKRPRYCATPGCGRHYVAKGFCGKHYQRSLAKRRAPV